VHHNVSAEEAKAKNPLAIILSGGPSSVYEPGSPQLDNGILELGIPVLGICYGFQVLASALGGRVDKTGLREYGATELTVVAGGEILAGQSSSQVCWMSHGDQVMVAPDGFEVLASTATTPVAAFANSTKKIYGVQWHPEVKHSQFGQNVLENFLHNAAGIPADWNSGNVIADQVEKIKAGLKDGSFAIWKGPIVGQDGKEVVKKDEVADDKFMSGINFYVKGVEGKVPAGK
jgi:GMP synthase (glutamine-hydrolysing)